MKRLLFVTLLLAGVLGHAQTPKNDSLEVSFAGKRGQLEIGGKYVGAEFHHSLPWPARISFFSPVANSIDLSRDYWQRGDSKPFTFILAVNGKIDTVGREPFAYRWTPYSAVFTQTKPAYKIEIAYRFCDNLPVMVVQTRIKNLTKQKATFEAFTTLAASLRTCQSYRHKEKARTTYINSGAVFLADFEEADTDSAQVFVANVGELPSARSETAHHKSLIALNQNRGLAAEFAYQKTLPPDSELVVIQLVGSCRQSESAKVLHRALREWQQSIDKYEHGVKIYVSQQARFVIPDSALAQTARWSKAILAANRHYLNGHIVPMPCPAEYNFYFTHDVLLTNLGAVLFDVERVKQDLLYLRSLTKPDSVLPHAYYWRDDGFKTEFCASDNWNHLWFIILISSYLKHSADRETVAALYPMLTKSLALMFKNKGADDLMYASRPDWWDMGNVYGARAYLTILMTRALRDFTYISLQLDKPQETLRQYLDVAQRMQASLTKNLWEEDSGYLLNMLEATTIDRHYYAGSLLAAVFDLLDEPKKKKLLETAARELLDDKLGIRNVMPADFDKLIDRYKLNGMEAGAPYVYANGGVWPHGIAWYALALLAAQQPEAARTALKKYLTLAGISNSPNGQPAFFEYRHADRQSPKYGEIDKPTFLWAAGWYLHVLYHLAGVKENEWNIAFDAHLPSGFEQIKYDLALNGISSEISWSGQGDYFKRILADGKPIHSAVILSSPQKFYLERGLPEAPYLAEASCRVTQVEYVHAKNALRVQVESVGGQDFVLKVAALSVPQKVFVDGIDRTAAVSRARDGQVVLATFRSTLVLPKANVVFQF